MHTDGARNPFQKMSLNCITRVLHTQRVLLVKICFCHVKIRLQWWKVILCGSPVVVKSATRREQPKKTKLFVDMSHRSRDLSCLQNFIMTPITTGFFSKQAPFWHRTFRPLVLSFTSRFCSSSLKNPSLEMSFSSRRRNYLLTPHRRDGLIEW